MTDRSFEGEQYRSFVRRNLDRIEEILAHISVGDFSKRLDISCLPDNEFTNVFYGLELLIEDLADAGKEVEEDNVLGRLRTEIWKSALVWTGDMEVLIQQLLDIIGPRIMATGICYFEIDSVSQDAVCKREWIPPGEESVIGLRIPKSVWAAYSDRDWAELRISAIEKSDGGKELAKLLRESGAGTLLGAFCGITNMPYGLIVFADRDETRKWKERERILLFELANIISAKASQAESAEALRLHKLEALGTLAGGLAHDLNNILTAITGNLSIAKNATDRKAAIEAIESAEAAAFHARRLANQFLTFSGGGAPVKEIASLGELIQSCTRFCLNDSDISTSIEIAADLHLVYIDRGQIEQVLTNLLINAKQAMPNGGKIHISAENAVIGKKTNLPLESGTYVRVTITDTGVGIPHQNLQRIFDPYFTTKKSGSGLGLAAAHSIIRKHGGYIFAASDGCRGASFTFYLPCSTLSTVSNKKIDDNSKKPRKGTKALVMDDDRTVRMVIARLLQANEIDVTETCNGPDALAAYIGALNEGRRFDFVIMDLTIAGGESGKETVEKLLAVDPKARAIVISGYSNDRVMSDFRSYGFCAMIPKPFQVEELLHAVDSALNG